MTTSWTGIAAAIGVTGRQRRGNMLRVSHLVTVVAVVPLGLVAAGRIATTAQEPTSQAAATPAAMTVEQTRATLDAYLATLQVAGGDFGQYFADDVVFEVVETGQAVAGRQAVVDAIVGLLNGAFTARVEVVSLVVGPGTAAGEFVFDGTHTGEFAGIPATDRAVRVPYAVFYDLANGEITALRAYDFAAGLLQQLTAEATPVAERPRT
jgi:predicted ester cyclase